MTNDLCKFKTTPLLSNPQPVGGVKQFSSYNCIHYEMRVKRFSAVAEFVGLFCASGLWKRLIEVMLGMASPHLAFHIVNKGMFSCIMGNEGKMRALLLLATRNSVCWLLKFWVNSALKAASSIFICPIVFKAQCVQFETRYHGWPKLKYLGLNAGLFQVTKTHFNGVCVCVWIFLAWQCQENGS